MPASPPVAVTTRDTDRPQEFRSARMQFLGRGAIVGAGLVVELGSQFARTMILARLLGATEFGLVVSINTLIAVVEMSCAIELDRYLVYAREGSDSRALGVAHVLALLRGLLAAALVAALAVPTAVAIGEPQYADGFALVALVPLVRGCTHFGPIQMQRLGRFWPCTAAGLLGAVAGLAVAVAAALITPDHRAILWGLIVQTAVTVVATHLLAQGHAYRLSFNRKYSARPCGLACR